MQVAQRHHEIRTTFAVNAIAGENFVIVVAEVLTDETSLVLHACSIGTFTTKLT